MSDVFSDIAVRLEKEDPSSRMQKLFQEKPAYGIALVPFHPSNGKPLNKREIGELNLDLMTPGNRKCWLMACLKETVAKQPMKMMPLESMIPVPEDGLSTGAYIVTNNEMDHFGAAALFYPGAKERISERLGGDFYMLPSSVHEVLCMSRDQAELITGADDPGKVLSDIVQNVNRTELRPEDVLQEGAYFYDSREKTLTPCFGPEREKEADTREDEEEDYER